MGVASWLFELRLICHDPNDHNGVGVVNIFHRQDGLADGIGDVDADLIAAGAQGRPSACRLYRLDSSVEDWSHNRRVQLWVWASIQDHEQEKQLGWK